MTASCAAEKSPFGLRPLYRAAEEKAWNKLPCGRALHSSCAAECFRTGTTLPRLSRLAGATARVGAARGR